MSYPTFTHEHPLPSLRVSKEMLTSLEQIIIKKVLDTEILTEEQARSALKIEIDDSLGSERINSISQMESARFSDSTTRVDMGLESRYRDDGKKIQIRFRFGKGRMFSTVAISATMPNARDVVLGIRDSLVRMLEPYRTWHWIVHPKPHVWGFVFGAGVFLVYAATQTPSGGKVGMLLATAILFVWLYLFQAGSFRPFTVFDSRAADRSDKIWGWFITGLATFVIFGTALTLLRRPLLGF